MHLRTSVNRSADRGCCAGNHAQLLRAVLLGTALVVVAQGVTTGASAQAGESGSWIETVSKQAQSILTGAATSETQREYQLEKLIVDSFDLESLDSFALGRQARLADADQLSRFERAFRNYAVRNFSRLIASNEGESLVVTKSSTISDQEALVSSRLGGFEDDRLDVGWLVRWKERSPKIVDVYVEGISMALTLRHEFSAFARSRGIEALVESLESGSLIPRSERRSRDAGDITHHLLQASIGSRSYLALSPE